MKLAALAAFCTIISCAAAVEVPSPREVPAPSLANTYWTGRTYSAVLSGSAFREKVVACEIHFRADGTLRYHDPIEGIVDFRWEQHNSEVRLLLGSARCVGIISEDHIVGMGKGAFPRKYSWWLVRVSHAPRSLR